MTPISMPDPPYSESLQQILEFMNSLNWARYGWALDCNNQSCHPKDANAKKWGLQGVVEKLNLDKRQPLFPGFLLSYIKRANKLRVSSLRELNELCPDFDHLVILLKVTLGYVKGVEDTGRLIVEAHNNAINPLHRPEDTPGYSG